MILALIRALLLQEGKDVDDRKQQDGKKKAGLLYIFKEKWNKGEMENVYVWCIYLFHICQYYICVIPTTGEHQGNSLQGKIREFGNS